MRLLVISNDADLRKITENFNGFIYTIYICIYNSCSWLTSRICWTKYKKSIFSRGKREESDFGCQLEYFGFFSSRKPRNTALRRRKREGIIWMTFLKNNFGFCFFYFGGGCVGLSGTTVWHFCVYRPFENRVLSRDN